MTKLILKSALILLIIGIAACSQDKIKDKLECYYEKMYETLEKNQSTIKTRAASKGIAVECGFDSEMGVMSASVDYAQDKDVVALARKYLDLKEKVLQKEMKEHPELFKNDSKDGMMNPHGEGSAPEKEEKKEEGKMN